MLAARGFCDLNVCIDGGDLSNLKRTCRMLLDLGYQTVAINTVCDGSIFDSKKKKKKGEIQAKSDTVPAPSFEDIIDEFQGKLTIYRRLTVTISDQLQSHKLNQSANAKKYNILAVIPATQTAFQHACSTMDVDIISFDPSNVKLVRCNRKLYNLAGDRGISFEIMYTPAIGDSTARKNIINLSHMYHAYGKSKHIIISSGASNPIHVRGPYDIINLGLLFGLSEEQAKNAITTACRFVLMKASGRRLGKTIVIAKKSNETQSDPLKDESEEIDEMELEQPMQKRLRQENAVQHSDFVNVT